MAEMADSDPMVPTGRTGQMVPMVPMVLMDHPALMDHPVPMDPLDPLGHLPHQIEEMAVQVHQVCVKLVNYFL